MSLTLGGDPTGRERVFIVCDSELRLHQDDTACTTMQRRKRCIRTAGNNTLYLCFHVGDAEHGAACDVLVESG